MGSANLHHKKKTGRLGRTRKKKSILPYILIVCEGEKTEPNYFGWYKNKCRQEVNVEIYGEGKNTSSLIEKANEIKKKKERKEDIVFDDVWCVFDKDSFEKEQYNKAFELCENYGFKYAYSNECFELWYLLHFNYYNSAMGRNDIYDKLNKLFKESYGMKYGKNSKDMFETLRDRQGKAISNAKKLLATKTDDFMIWNRNPTTTVFELVEELNKYLK
ncbi:MAG: RloB family protein [Clostridia bacterium]|jgi:hypothetical protein|nr:RloB family protein [Clostridia bacterium]